jgi:DNA polymerase I-like protein with 3'-5' exonuclease and polymerase domains
MKRLAFDLETDGLLPTLTKVHCMSVVDVDTGKEWTFTHPDYEVESSGKLANGLELLATADVLYAHNGQGFDYRVLERLYNFTPPGRALDTSVMSRLAFPDIEAQDYELIAQMNRRKTPIGTGVHWVGFHNLKSWGIRLGIHKGDYGDDRTDWSVFDTQMLSYCMQDSRVCTAAVKHVEKKLAADRAACESAGKRYYDPLELEHEFNALLVHQIENGFSFNVEAATALTSVLMQERARLTGELQSLFLPRTVVSFTPKKQLRREKQVVFNPASRDHIATWLTEKYGWKPKDFTESGKPKIDEEVLEHLSYPEATLLCRYLMIEKRLGSVAEGKNAWLKLVGSDGKMHGAVISIGTPHSRCAHFKPNMAQVPNAGSEYGHECRALFSARPGWKLIGCDAKGMQLRGLAHYMARYDGGEYAKVVTTGDPHTINMHAMEITDRNRAKSGIYAFLFGAGDKKLAKTVGVTNGGALRKRLLSNLPALGALVAAVSGAAKRGYILAIDGRVVPLRSDHSALNYLLASAEAVIMKRATVMFDQGCAAAGLKRGIDYALVAHVHDEYQIEARPECADTVASVARESVRLAGEFYSFQCPLEGETKVGLTWDETH